MMKRYLTDALLADLPRKILLLTGPRQCGKTTLAKSLLPEYDCLNYDFAEHRRIFREKSWDRSKPLIIFDELHKMQRWKSWLKGIYDVEGIPPALLATGSARLSAFRKTGDSLAGRHFEYRLHPLDLKEAVAHSGIDRAEAFRRLMRVGGFPEPFLDGRKTYYERWKRSHADLILKEDLITLTAMRDIQAIETLIELLRARVGSPVSAASLASDLQKSPATVQSWLKLLADLYVVFPVAPFHRNVARAILKAPKYYFYDAAMVQGEPGLVLENLVACALLKETHRLADVEGEMLRLNYIRTRDGHEIDFLVTRGRRRP
jgi:predicted AAA+ superfamily ATPase